MDGRRCVAAVATCGAVAATVALAAAGGAVTSLPEADVVASCRYHLESGDAPLVGPRPGSLRVGRLSFTALGSTPRGPAGAPGHVEFAGRTYLTWKSATLVAAGGPVTVSVAPRYRDAVLIGVGAASGYYDSVRYEPCPPGRRAFSYHGTVGRWTGWSGVFVATRRVCAKLAIWDGDEVIYGHVPLGAACR